LKEEFYSMLKSLLVFARFAGLEEKEVSLLTRRAELTRI